MWYVYILECMDGSFYTGITTSIQNRVKHHFEGIGARYTKINQPKSLRYFEEFVDKSSACRREIAIKKLPKNYKKRLIQSGPGTKL